MNKQNIIKRVIIAVFVLVFGLGVLYSLKLGTSSRASSARAVVNFSPSTVSASAGNTFDSAMTITTTDTAAKGFSAFKIILRYDKANTGNIDILSAAEGGAVSIVGNSNYTNILYNMKKGTDSAGKYATFAFALPIDAVTLNKSVIFKFRGKALKNGSDVISIDSSKSEIVGQTGEANPIYAIAANNTLKATVGKVLTGTPMPNTTVIVPTSSITPTPATQPTTAVVTNTITSTTTASLDDTALAGSSFSTSSTTSTLGKDMTTSSSVFQVFHSLSIPSKATITQAYLDFGVANSGGNTINLSVAAQATGNATAPSTAATFTTMQSSLTTSKVAWSAVPHLSWGGVITSPNLASVIQEVVNRSDWQSGNNIAMYITDASSDNYSNTTVFTYDFKGAGQQPQLRVTYTTSGSVVTTSPTTVVSSTATPTLTPTKTPTAGPTVTTVPTVTPTQTPQGPTPTAPPGATQITVPITFNATSDLYYKELTIIAKIGPVSYVSVTANGTTIPSTYTSSTGTLVFTTSSSPVTITVAGATGLGSMTLSKAPLKYNKKWAWSQSFDDNVNLKASVEVLKAKNWRGLFFLIGNEVDKTRDESWIVDKPYLVTQLNQGWSIGNHTWDHNCSPNDKDGSGQPSGYASIAKGYEVEKDIVNSSAKTNYRIIAFATPCFIRDYDPIVAADIAAKLYEMKFNETQGSGIMIINPGAGSYSSGGYTADAVSSTTQPIGRDSDIDGYPEKVTAVMDWMSSNAQTGRNFWLNTFLHGNRESSLSTVVDHAYSKYGLGGTDELWMAPSDEIYSYFIVRDNAVIGTVSIH